MKKIHLFKIIILVVIVFVSTNCTKNAPIGNTTAIVAPPPPTTPAAAINTSPKANAGSDKLLILPVNSCLLTGSAYDKENNIQLILWSKISGPASFIIENGNSFSTTVKNLELELYQFELMVKDAFGLISKDTIAVTVGQISTNPTETIFENLNWGTQGLFGTLLWGSAILIPNIYQYVPEGNVFKVFIKKGSSANWEELLFDEHSWYGVYLVNGTLIVWSTYDETEPVDIKLVY